MIWRVSCVHSGDVDLKKKFLSEVTFCKTFAIKHFAEFLLKVAM